MSERLLVRAAVACLVAGALAMLVPDHWIARLAGVLLLAAFIALGTIALASPANLGGDGEGDGAAATDPGGSPPSAATDPRRRGG